MPANDPDVPAEYGETQFGVNLDPTGPDPLRSWASLSRRCVTVLLESRRLHNAHAPKIPRCKSSLSLEDIKPIIPAIFSWGRSVTRVVFKIEQGLPTYMPDDTMLITPQCYSEFPDSKSTEGLLVE